MTTQIAGRQPAVELSGVTRRFGDVQAVDGIDLTIGRGEVVALLGPNGAGKTTTIDMLLGLGQPTTGTVQVLGTSPRRAVERGLVAAVMQSGGLLKDLTARETVTYIASLFPTAMAVDRVMERAGITDIAGRRVGRCSGGEQQRLRFALALLPDPALIILDEPTTGMDVGARHDFWDAIRQDAARGRTILFATHYLQEADQFADRIIMMRGGSIVADGTGAQLKARASGRTIRATVSDPHSPAWSQIPGVASLTFQGNTLIVRGADTDVIAHHLLTRTDAHDLEITANDLEDAFLNLTGASR